MTLASSSTTVKRQPPLLPSQLPTTQAGWTQLVTAMQEQYQSLQSAQSAPNVLPAQYSVAQASGVPPYTNTNCAIAEDPTHALYATNAFMVTVTGAGAVAKFTGFPIAIQANQLWYCAFQVWGANFEGSLGISTSAGTLVSSGIASTTNDDWQLVWTLLDLTAYPDTQATWEITFTYPGQYWIDGLQMSPVGKPFLSQPPFVVGTGSVTAGSISGSSLAPGSVTGGVGGAIAPVTVTYVNIAPQTIQTDLIAPVAITTELIADFAVTAAQVANNTLTSGQIALYGLTAESVATNTLTADKIAANTLTSGQIAAASILGLSIATNTITALQVADNTLTSGQIQSQSITSDSLAANSVTSLQVAANAIDTNALQAGAVTALKIATNSITALQIAANTITSGQLNVTSLSAISGNLGTVTEGTVIFDNGTYMRVMGIGFGASSNLLDWYGPHLSSISLCSESNATFYQDISGNSYHGGYVNYQTGSSASGNYIKFPADAAGRVYIWQFGTTAETMVDPSGVTFPVAYPHACLSVVANPIYAGGGGLPATVLDGNPTTTGFEVYSGGFGYSWQAIGY